MTRTRQIFLTLTLTTLILAACTQSSASPQPTYTQTSPTLEARLISTQAPSLITRQPIDAQACAAQGRMARYQLESEALNDSLFFSVYFPPCYDAEMAGGYPALYLLHGQNFDDRMWIDLGAAAAADALIAAGDARPFLMVLPWEEFFFREADGNQFPDALINEIIPWVERSLNTCAGMDCRALGGISRGASWAMRIGLTQTGVFSSLGAHSLPTFRGDLGRLPDWLEGIPDDILPRIYLDTGRFDPEVKAAYRFEGVLNEKGIPHEWHLNEGRHNEEYWTAQMEDYMRWYAAGWEPGK